MPPNQAASQKSQKVINERLGIEPPYKNTKEIILKKSKSLQRNLNSKIIEKLEAIGQTAIFSDKDEIIWLGSDRNGVTAYKNDDFYNYSMADGLASNNVYDIIQSTKGLIYFACYGGGISVWDGKRFTDLYGELPDKRIFSLALDHDQNLWLGMESGVAVYNGESIKTFTKSDGLAHNETRVLEVDDKGRIWAGSFGGGVSCYDNGYGFH